MSIKKFVPSREEMKDMLKQGKKNKKRMEAGKPPSPPTSKAKWPPKPGDLLMR